MSEKINLRNCANYFFVFLILWETLDRYYYKLDFNFHFNLLYISTSRVSTVANQILLRKSKNLQRFEDAFEKVMDIIHIYYYQYIPLTEVPTLNKHSMYLRLFFI